MPRFPHVCAVAHAPADEMHEHLMDDGGWDGAADRSDFSRPYHPIIILSSIRFMGNVSG